MNKSPISPRKPRKSKPQKSPYVPIWVMPNVRQKARDLAALRQQNIAVVVEAELTRALEAALAVEARVQALIAAGQTEAPQ